MKIRLFCTRAAGYTERGLARVFSTTRIARLPSIQVPGTGERSGLYTGTRYMGEVWPLQVSGAGEMSGLHRYKVEVPGIGGRSDLNTGTRCRGKSDLFTGIMHWGEYCMAF